MWTAVSVIATLITIVAIAMIFSVSWVLSKTNPEVLLNTKTMAMHAFLLVMYSAIVITGNVKIQYETKLFTIAWSTITLVDMVI